MSLYKGLQLISGAIPNSANQSLSNLDSAGQDKFDAKVNKSGDTMTGDLTIRPDSSPHIFLQNSNFTKGTNPSSNIYWEYRAEDGNTNPAEWYTNRVGNFVTTAFTDGTIETAMFAYQNNQNANTAASIYTRITSAGVASCNFPNTTCCDGQWVKHDQAIMSNVNIHGSTPLTYTLTLPDDGYAYEVLLSGSIVTGTTLGNALTLQVNSNIVGNSIICWTANRGTNSASMRSGGSVIIPVSSNHTIYVSRANDYTGTATLVMRAYRRIGLNA